MNGPWQMYQTKQIVQHDFHVELPKTMYNLKNIHDTRNGMVDGLADHVSSPHEKLDIFDQNNHKISGMAELELRQEQILQQLAELKEQMLSIKSKLNITTSSGTKSTSSTSKISTSVNVTELPDVVINANPNNPPYSLAFAQKLLQHDIELTVTSHLHSTVSTLPENARLLSETVVNFKPQAKSVPKLQVRLIWKEVEANVELLVSHFPIHGEVNVLRYFARLSSNRLSYNSDCQVDSLLDVCYLIVTAKNKTSRAKLLQILNKSLGKSQFMAGRSQIGIADVAAFSAVKQVGATSELNVSLGKWFQRCETVF